MPYIKILEDYNKFTETPILNKDGSNVFYISTKTQNLQCFKNVENTKFDIFYKNLHLHITDTENFKVTTISLKKNNDVWTVSTENDMFDTSNPVNDTMEIFCWYDVLVMNRKRCEGIEYVDGTWNKHFYNTLLELEKTITGFTLTAQFTEEYRSKKEKTLINSLN